MSKKLIALVIVVIIVLGVLAYVNKKNDFVAGSLDCGTDTCLTTLKVSGETDMGSALIGSSGTLVTQVVSGSCTLTTTAAQLPIATSSKPFDCAITGVASGDVVHVTLASDGGSLGGTPGIIMTYAKASTTANHIEVGLAIPFGAFGSVATSSFPLATTSAKVLIYR